LADSIVGGDLTLGAKVLRAESQRLEEAGFHAGAKRHREAAWRLDEAAAWLRGERGGQEVANA
jgi:hypothetical protein